MKESTCGQEVLENKILDSYFTKSVFIKYFFISHLATLSSKSKQRFGRKCSVKKPSALFHFDPVDPDAWFLSCFLFSWSLK